MDNLPPLPQPQLPAHTYESKSIDQIIGALFDFTKNYQSPAKDSKVDGRNYKYLSLNGLLDHIRLPLLEVGLLIKQDLAGATIVTSLYHASGQYMKSVFHIPALTDKRLGNDAQNLGAAITYARRYAINAVLGISTEEDPDGNKNNQNKHKQQPTQRPQSTPPTAIEQPREKQLVRLKLELRDLARLDSSAAAEIEQQIEGEKKAGRFSADRCSNCIDYVKNKRLELEKAAAPEVNNPNYVPF